jgi:O-6-methylguanine DNA methyltransferase
MGLKNPGPRGPKSWRVIFDTPLGWTAGTWVGGRVRAMTFGHDSHWAASISLAEVEKSSLGSRPGSVEASVREASTPLLLEDVHSSDCLQLIEDEFAEEFADELTDEWKRRSSGDAARQLSVTREAERVGEFARRLFAFCEGEVVDFLDIPLDDSVLTPFRRRVTEACRAIPYGTTLSYAELAERVGTPRGARAVGNVMRRNPWPLLVPCHRVVASSGKLGGYSAPDGLSMKRRLLSLESDGLQAQRDACKSGHVITEGPCIAIGSIG